MPLPTDDIPRTPERVLSHFLTLLDQYAATPAGKRSAIFTLLMRTVTADAAVLAAAIRARGEPV